MEGTTQQSDSQVPLPGVYAAETYASAQLPDKRLHRRLVQTATLLAARAHDSIPQACGGWDHIKAAYRFFQNERVTVEHLTQPVLIATANACANKKEILLVQDTSTISFPNARATEGLGPVNDKDSRGLLLHVGLALRADGRPLGALSIRQWARDSTQTGSRHLRNERPIEEKESNKWLTGMNDAREALATLEPSQRPRLIHVMDREGDVHEVLADVLAHGDGAVIRQSRDRKVEADGGSMRVLTALAAAPTRGIETVEVPRRHNIPSRVATVEARAIAVTVTPVRRHEIHRDRQPVSMNVVEIKEVDAPHDVAPLDWVLWTTEPIDTEEDIRRVVDLYRMRWRVEDMFRVLKGGCAVEELQMETAERLMKTIALYVPIAVRLLTLRDAARTDPEEPCTTLLSEIEWRVLYFAIKKSLPKKREKPPTMRQAVLWIGRLGGHLNRKGDGMPGVKTLWRGWRDLDLLVCYQRELDTLTR